MLLFYRLDEFFYFCLSRIYYLFYFFSNCAAITNNYTLLSHKRLHWLCSFIERVNNWDNLYNHHCTSVHFCVLIKLINHGHFQDPEDAAGFAPSFIEKPRIIPNEQGTLITMSCKCKAKPKPNVTWFRGTNVVKESSKISIKTIDVQEDVYELILEIKVNSSTLFNKLHF